MLNRQAFPFHVSVKVRPGLPERTPTATQRRVVAQETAVRSLPLAPLRGLGVGRRTHLRPFHFAASVLDFEEPFTWKLPTARQTVAEGHDTLERLLYVVLGGLGVLSTVHFLPFQVSAKALFLDARIAWPTAVQCAADRQETASRLLSPAPRGAGTDITRQAVPVHLSASGREPCGTSYSPTATQARDELHETSKKNVPIVAFRG